MTQRSLVFGAVLAALAFTTHAQSSVTLYGVVDLGMRISDSQGPGGAYTVKSVMSGGLAPSRWGLNVVEDLGGGLKAIANLDRRFQADTGVGDPGPDFQQSWVGLQSASWGRVTLGRQYNVLFDVTASTFGAFMPVGPFLNAYKPDVALALGVRNDNQVKYQLVANGWTLALQASAGEGAPFSTTMGKSRGGMLKYSDGPIGVGGGYLERRDNADRKAQASLLGAAYTKGPLYLNVALASARFDDGLNTALLMVGTGVENTIAPARPGQLANRVRQRDMWSVGGTYEVAPAFFVGAQYWSIRQSFHTPGAPEGRGRFLALLVDYFLSRRTDLYASVDRTTLTHLQLTSSPSGVPNGATRRTAWMVGMRHRF
ncbi:porin [Variovorax sp. JS1663]|uniref:porin n=1 Tax=Variovorax sp. JS1663 TaxID=1851577 RepID=UPI000B341C9A|nr:porin [Variovorax sp. JS1663]OUM02456.1 hypothetical protein A8M77_10815 [Variovorax sp. JS1663]OUM02459.1 hypothetical protein A8M77_10830 [Variovorax sp. JS1663]